MNKLIKYKVDISLIILLLSFILISFLSIQSATKILESDIDNLATKQMLWYLIGFLVAGIIFFIKNNEIIKHIWILYIIFNIILFLLLIFGKPINDAKCWFQIKGIGTIQPSEFMKVILIIVISKMIFTFNDKHPMPTIKEEFIFLVEVGIVVLIPSILTFLEPDTGVVLIYLLITITMLFISGIRYRWFNILLFICIFFLISVVGTYFINQDLFIKIFGTDFFLRIDRLLDWSNKSGYQLKNALVSIGSSGFIGHGLNKTPLYFPEPQTDFIFAVYSSNFGFIGSLFLIILIGMFDIKLIKLALKNKSNINKYIIAGIVGMLLYQQFQNIGMTFGLMPITGITLPFISYGGSSLLSYMIMIGIIFNISIENMQNKNH